MKQEQVNQIKAYLVGKGVAASNKEVFDIVNRIRANKGGKTLLNAGNLSFMALWHSGDLSLWKSGDLTWITDSEIVLLYNFAEVVTETGVTVKDNSHHYHNTRLFDNKENMLAAYKDELRKVTPITGDIVTLTFGCER
jgi:hypothetical protein